MKKWHRILACLLVFGAAAIMIYLKSSSTTETARVEPVTTAGVSLPKLLDLGAETCVPCKRMMPILDELARNYSDTFIVEVVNVREHREVATEYNVQIIPTQIFFDEEGAELFRHQGFISRSDILSKWQELGFVIPIREPSQ